MPKNEKKTSSLSEGNLDISEIYESIHDVSVDPIIVINPKGVVVSFNTAAEKISAYKAKEVIGKNINVIMPDPYRSEHDSYLENYQKTGIKKIIGIGREVSIQTKSGQIVPIHLSISEAKIKGKQYFIGIARDISDLKKAEGDLKNSEERSAAILNTAVDGIVSINTKGIVQSFNPAAAKLFAYEPSEVIGKNVKVLMPDPYSSEHDSYLSNYQNTGIKKIIGVGREVTGRRKDGSTFPAYLSISEFKINNEVFFTGILRDISEAKEAEQRINKANETLSIQAWIRQGLVNLQDSIKGNISYEDTCSKALREIALYTSASVGTMYVIKDKRLYFQCGYSYPSDVQKEIDLNEGLIGRAAVERQLVKISDINAGSVKLKTTVVDFIPQEIIVLPLMFNSSTIAVIELSYAEKTKKKVINLLDAIKDSLGVSINSAKSREEVESLLEETQKQAVILHERQEELKASNEELEQKSEELQSQQQELETINAELEEQRSELEQQKQALETTNGKLESTRKELERKAEDLERSGRYKSEFLANMSHELRTPLNSILILSKIIEENREANLSKEQIENAATIYSSGQDLLNLINDILDLSKVEAGKLDFSIESVSLQSIANDLKNNFNAIAQNKGLDFQVELDPSLDLFIETDSLRLEQILRNFLSNAFKFTETGGVTLSFKKLSSFNTDSLSKAFDFDRDIAITVKDSGMGIPEHKKRLIFEAFQQVDGTITRRFGGTGLGLSIARSLADKLGGEIILNSDLGKGSSFTLCLPRQLKFYNTASSQINGDKRDDNHHNGDDDRNNLKPGDKVVQIIDDNLTFAKSLAKKCQDLQYKVIISINAEQAMQDLGQFRPQGMLLDINLPDKNGLVLLDQLKHNPQTKNIPIFTMSVDDYSQDSAKLNALGFLNKIDDHKNIASVLSKIEAVNNNSVKKILLLEDNQVQRNAIEALISDKFIEVDTAETAKEALEMLKNNSYDCFILDLKLPDMSGFQLLDKLKEQLSLAAIPPTIVYTGKDLNQEEQRMLDEYSSSIILKGAKSPERLLNEVSLFLHKLDSELSEDKQKQLKTVNHRDEIFETKKILIVDDDIRNTYSIKQILQGRGLDLKLAMNGREAVDEVLKEADFDLVLMDIMMPEMDGYEAMMEIRKNFSKAELPIIAVTAKAMQGDKDKCLSYGANDYISKPIDPNNLLSLIRVWLSSKSLINK